MIFSNTVRSLLTGLLVVANYLQLQADISHTWHVVIVCGSLFLGSLGINSVPSSKSEDEVKI